MRSPLILAVDVSKGYGDFVLMDSDKSVVEDCFRLDDNAEGHSTLKRQLKTWYKTYRASRIIYVAESTGGYEDNWLRIGSDTLVCDFVDAYRINAKIIYHEYEAQRRSSVNDGISALTIAEHVAKNLDKFAPKAFAENEEYKAARSLVRHLSSLERDCTGHKNSLLKLLYQYLPSLEALRPTHWADYFLEILIRYGSRKSIQIAARKGFKLIARVPKGKAKQIADGLEKGVDLRDTPEIVVATIRSKAAQIKHLTQEIKVMEKLLITTAPVNEQQVQVLRSLKGMGEVTPVVLLCFIEDFNRFDDAKKMAAFFGVPPRIKSSGDGQYKPRMSKQGAGLVRKELYLLAFRCLSSEPYLSSIYAKCRKKGMTHDAALGCLMHKLIRIIYGMLKSGRPFDAGVDQLNQERKVEAPASSQQPKNDPAKRFQSPGLDAPLSRRQRKKRKEMSYEPQADGVPESAGSS